jgi:DNA-binding transcriptional MocR family regulator
MDWVPTLSEWQGPLFMRIVDALAADIESGRLVRGQRLPTHRALATELGIDLTTVTRAYGEARRRGLLDARVGQGTFVSETTVRSASHVASQITIDLSMNLPPQPVEANLDLRIAQGLDTIRRESGFSAFLTYSKPGGSDLELETAADWLRHRVSDANAERLVIFPGSQAIVFNALLALTSPGDVVLTEALTYPGLKTAAARLGVRLIGLPMDEQGVRPDALKDACRKAIAEIIRNAGTFLIEDDVYGPLEPSASPIANLIPERTYFAASMSKCIAPGLRVAYLQAPDTTAAQTMRSGLQATMQMSPPLMVALVTYWIRNGIADEIIEAIRNEAKGRQQLASRILKGIAFASRPTSHHLWLELPPSWNRMDLLSHLLRHGLAVVGEDAFAVIDKPPRGIRVSLGAARNRADVSQAMQVLAAAMKLSVMATQIV